MPQIRFSQLPTLPRGSAAVFFQIFSFWENLKKSDFHFNADLNLFSSFKHVLTCNWKIFIQQVFGFFFSQLGVLEIYSWGSSIFLFPSKGIWVFERCWLDCSWNSCDGEGSLGQGAPYWRSQCVRCVCVCVCVRWVCVCGECVCVVCSVCVLRNTGVAVFLLSVYRIHSPLGFLQKEDTGCVSHFSLRTGRLLLPRISELWGPLCPWQTSLSSTQWQRPLWGPGDRPFWSALAGLAESTVALLWAPLWRLCRATWPLRDWKENENKGGTRTHGIRTTG